MCVYYKVAKVLASKNENIETDEEKKVSDRLEIMRVEVVENGLTGFGPFCKSYPNNGIL